MFRVYLFLIMAGAYVMGLGVYWSRYQHRAQYGDVCWEWYQMEEVCPQDLLSYYGIPI
jgi:hypothetical protein